MKVPHAISKKYGIPEEQGKCRDVPRVWLSYQGPKKFQFVSTITAMIVSAALPEEGQKRYSRAVTQSELAQISGLGSRSTVTRRLVRFYDAGDGLRVLSRRRRFATANAYAFGAIGRSAAETVEKYHSPTPAELASHAETGALWCADPEYGVAGFKGVPRWIWDARIPISDTARMVLTYYCMCGLLERGECHPRQSVVARALGISVRTVYEANQALAAEGIIRVAHPKPIRRQDGSLCRGPARIVYLPMRSLSAEEAAAEKERLVEAQKRRRDLQYWQQTQQAHQELLDAWTGKEHNLNAFWKELRKRLLLAGIPRQAINDLIPRPSD